MGIRGITGHLKKRSPPIGCQIALETLKNVIIDGNSMLYHFARNPELNWIKGPNYTKFFKIIKEFCELFTQRGVSVTVVFDGWLDEYKIPERNRRNYDKLMHLTAVAAAVTTNSTDDVQGLAVSLLPPFAWSVAVDSVLAAGVECLLAKGEADNLIAKLACLRRCEVISQDSDFFFYAIPGYIPLNSITILSNSENTNDFDNENTPELHKNITARKHNRYEVARALDIPVPKLPLLAVLLGNDTFPSEHTKLLFPNKRGKSIGIQSLIKLVRTLPICRCVPKTSSCDIPGLCSILERINIPWKDKFLDAVLFTHKLYNNCKDSDIGYITLKKQDTIESRDLFGMISMRAVNYKILEVLETDNFWCNLVLEPLEKESVWNKTLPIRKYLYTFIANGPVTEHFRIQRQMQQRKVCEFENSILELAEKNPKYLKRDLFVITLRYMIKYESQFKRICNYEVCSLVVMFVLMSGKYIKIKNSMVTMNAVARLVEFEVVMFCMSLVIPFAIPGCRVSDEDCWSIINGECFHWVSEQAKRGATPKRMLMIGGVEKNALTQNLALFRELYSLCIKDISDCVDEALDYNDIIDAD